MLQAMLDRNFFPPGVFGGGKAKIRMDRSAGGYLFAFKKLGDDQGGERFGKAGYSEQCAGGYRLLGGGISHSAHHGMDQFALLSHCQAQAGEFFPGNHTIQKCLQ